MGGSFEQPKDAEARHDEAAAGGTPAEQQLLHLTWPAADCSRIQPLLEAFHDGALSDVDADIVREHVARCARCAAHVRRYEEIDAVLRLAAAPRVGSELRTRLYTRIAATQQRRGVFAMFGSGRKERDEQETDGQASGYWGSGSRRAEARSVFGGGRPGLVTSWINGMAAIAVVLLLVLLFNTLMGMPERARVSSTSTASGRLIATLTGLPKFSDYRAAYLDFEGRLQFVAANGQIVTGPTLPNTGLLMRVPAAPYYDVDVSQDGHYLAYVEGDASARDATTPLPDGYGGPVAIVNLKTGAILSMPVVANDLSWSPDSRLLAAPDANTSNNHGDVNIVDAATGLVHQLKASFEGRQALIPLVAGWIDSAHIAVFYQQSDSGPVATPSAATASQSTGSVQQSLGSLDIHSGAITYLADLPDPSDVFLSPDGREVLLAPNVSTSMAHVVDTRTGQSRELPHISDAFVGKFADLGAGGNWALHSAWQPGTGHVLALSLSVGSSLARQDANVWLLDLDADSQRQVASNAYPLAWSPESPQELLLCDPPHADATGEYPLGGAGVGPTLYTIKLVAPGTTSPPLTESMAVFLGLVRTA
ncbi:MAG TPA: zf-HC2 domain-containing protein [Ktedonobacterales bacterium]